MSISDSGDEFLSPVKGSASSDEEEDFDVELDDADDDDDFLEESPVKPARRARKSATVLKVSSAFWAFLLLLFFLSLEDET
jgi:hypothetical protein